MKNKNLKGSGFSRSWGQTNLAVQRALTSPIEMLERRVLLSVSGSDLGGSFSVVGDQWAYTLTTADGQSANYVVTVIGPTTFNGHSCTELDGTFDANGKIQQSFRGVDSGGNLVAYGSIIPDFNGNRQVDTFAPDQVGLVASMDAGVTYTFSDTDTTDMTDPNGSTTTNVTDETVELTLLSDSTAPVTVPAGTYDAYQVKEVVTDSTPDGIVENTLTTTQWYVAGIGTVKSLDSTGTGYALTHFGGKKDHLEFSQQPATAAAGTVIQPPVTVELKDSTGAVDTSASGTVTLNLISASRLTTSTGTLGGTASAPVVAGIATFSDLTVSENGTYRLQASDAAGDDGATSNKFRIGPSTLQLEITSHTKGGAKGAASGDIILYSLLVTSKKPVQSAVLTDTLPAGFVPTDITGGGVFSGNTITWNTTERLVHFQVVVPDAKTLDGLANIVTTADDNVVYADSATDEATATNSVKLATSYEIKGTLHDALFQFPNKLLVTTKQTLGGITVNLIDDTGTTVDTVITKASGVFSVGAGKPGTYTLEFVALADSYVTAANGLSNQHVYVGRSVTIPKSNTKPIDVGVLVLPRTFFNTSAKILRSLNNYTTTGFQNLPSFGIDLFQFNTTGAESALSALAGTADNPSPPMNVDALKAGAPTDPWVAAMRMMAGLAVVDQRFVDTFRLADQTGKAIAVIASAEFSKFLGKSLAQLNRKLPGQPSWVVSSLSTVDQKLNQATRVAGFTAMGSTLGLLLDSLGVTPAHKNVVMAITFNVLRYASDIFSGKLIDDLGFELVFNLIRLTMDAAMLELLTGATVRHDVVAPYNQIGTALNFTNSLGVTTNSMQDVINRCVGDRMNYNTGTDTLQVFKALDAYDGALRDEAAKGMRNTGIFNSINGLLRGDLGVLKLTEKAQEIDPTVQLSTFQAALQNVLTKANAATQNVLGKTTLQLQEETMVGIFASSAFSLSEQTIATALVSNIVASGSALHSSSVNTGHLSGSTGGASLAAEPAASLAPSSQAGAIIHGMAGAIPAASESGAYLADLAQLALLVKAGDVAGIGALYPAFQADDQALFGNDLILLDNQANALASQLATGPKKAVSRFDEALHAAINCTLIAQLQLDAWGSSPATGDPKAVRKQIALAVAAVKAVAKQATTVRAIIAGLAVPLTLEIDQTTVPLQLASGVTQPFVFTITNISSQPSAAGTITFANSNGSLVLQGPAQQDLPALTPGASAIFTWQVQAMTPPTTDFGAVFQITATAGDQMSAISDEVFVN